MIKYCRMLTPQKTYATEANAIKAVEEKFSEASFQYTIVNDLHGRFYPICMGNGAVQAGAHFYFIVIA